MTNNQWDLDIMWFDFDDVLRCDPVRYPKRDPDDVDKAVDRLLNQEAAIVRHSDVAKVRQRVKEAQP